MRNATLHGLVDTDVVGAQDIASSLVELDTRTIICTEGSDFNGLCLRQVTLGLNHKEDRRSAQSIFLLLGIQRLLLQYARFLRRLIAGTRLLQADNCVLHINANLIQLLALPQFILA